MNERDLNTALLESFPELSEQFNEYTAWQNGLDTGAFLTYEDVFRPHIQKALGHNDAAFLERAASFIEALFLSGDEYATNVVVVGILEGLKANCDNISVRAFLKEVTLEQFDALSY